MQILPVTIHELLADIFYIVATITLPYVIALIRKLLKTRKADSRGTMILLRIQMIQYHAKCMERGFITKHGLQNFLEMYDIYHNLEGNGFVERLRKDLKALPFQEPGIESMQYW